MSIKAVKPAIKPRYLEAAIKEDLKMKMVFIGGPRQVGKTTLALGLLAKNADEQHPAYLNWDLAESRDKIRKGLFPANETLIILDEIHKYPKWKSLIKGYYDTNKSKINFLVTGSARLDIYRKGGDSLQGRYHYYRMHPLSLTELNIDSGRESTDLMNFGGFPEPFFSQNITHWRRWQKERLERVVFEDVRDLENLKNIQLLEELAIELPRRVGSPLSIKSLREDLNVAHETAEHWTTILEKVYYCFRIPPFGSPRIRAVKKEQKLYLWDWSLCENIGARFENMVASHLLKFCHYQEDTLGHRMELRFLRTKDSKEIDFVILQDGKPLFAVECKTGEQALAKSISYFKERTPIPMFYQVHMGSKDYVDARTGARVLPFWKFCKELGLP